MMIRQQSNDGKVVRLMAGNENTYLRVGAEATALLGNCETQVLIGLKGLLTRMFGRADDLLFDMAEQGKSGASQEEYVDGMRDIRMKRDEVEKAFNTEMRAGFKAFAEGADVVQAPTTQPAKHNEPQLSLVGDEELEENLALETMAEKANDRYSDQLEDLAERFGRLRGQTDLEPIHLPFGPKATVQAIRTASDVLEVSLKVRLIFFKLFDRYILNNMEDLLKQVEAKLDTAGVAPGSHQTEDAAASAAGPEQAPTQTPAGPQGYPQQGYPDAAVNAFQNTVQPVINPEEAIRLFDTLKRLLGMPAGQQGQQGQQGQPAGQVGMAAGYGAGPMAAGYAAPPQQQIVRALSSLQTNIPGIMMQGGGQPLAGSGMNPILIEQLAGGEGQGGHAALQHGEEDVIDVVGMLFDFILGDRNLSSKLKVVLARLQIPLVKVAILDRSFFTKKQHPARRLLNDLAQAGIGLGDDVERRDAVQAEIERIVDRVLNDFDDEISLFDELLAEFHEFMGRTQRRTKAVEERQVKTLEGKERLELAKAHVNSDISDRIHRGALPSGLRTFLDEKWRHHLLITYLKVGANGSEYTNALNLMDRLVWTMEPKHSPSERQEVVDSLRPLLTTLRDALVDTFMDPDVHKAPFFKQLQEYQFAALRGQDPAEEERKTQPASEQTQRAPEPTEFNIPDDALHPEAEPAAHEAPAPNDGFSRQAREITEGTWLEYSDEEGERQRVKLSWRSPMTARCLFVNSRGLKELELTADEFAQYLRSERLATLADAPLVDRALGALVKGIKKGLPGR